MNPQQEMLSRKLGLTAEEAGVALELFRDPLPARAQLHTGLRVRLLPGAVPPRAARGMVKRGWLRPEVRPPVVDGRDEAEQPQERRAVR